MTSKNCTLCKELKPLLDFCKLKVSPDRHQYHCKACDKIKKDAYRHTRDGVASTIYYSQKSSSKSRGHQPPTYTVCELRNWCYKNVDFDRLYLNWANSGYDKMKTPSCDRRDDYLPYTLDNILRVCTWQENYDRSLSDRKNGINNKTNRSVMQLTTNDECVAEFHSMAYASRVTGFDVGGIRRCCNGLAKICGKHRWRFA